MGRVHKKVRHADSLPSGIAGPLSDREIHAAEKENGASVGDRFDAIASRCRRARVARDRS
jgi:hypothetical protein